MPSISTGAILRYDLPKHIPKFKIGCPGFCDPTKYRSCYCHFSTVVLNLMRPMANDGDKNDNRFPDRMALNNIVNETHA
jgi:hypothetical protein